MELLPASEWPFSLHIGTLEKPCSAAFYEQVIYFSSVRDVLGNLRSIMILLLFIPNLKMPLKVTF